jgi:hypothetical protein
VWGGGKFHRPEWEFANLPTKKIPILPTTWAGIGESMGQYELQPGEVELGTWTLNFLPHGGGRFTGPLTVTNQRILFDAKFNTSFSGVLRELIVFKGSWGFVSIPKDRIKNVETQSGILKKKVLITLDNGNTHTLDYGLLAVQKLADAIKQR